MSIGGRLVLLAVALVAGREAQAADDHVVRLDAASAARHYAFDSDWARDREWIFEETLQAAVDSYLVERALSAYHLGFALDYRSHLQDTGRSYGVMGYRYDARLKIWPEGDVPVSFWANRQTSDAFQAAVSQYRAASTAFGYNAAVAPSPRLPRFQSAGYVQDMVSERDGEVQQARNSDLSATFFHTDERLVARGSLARRLQERPDLERTREQLQGDILADYRFSSTAALSARARQQELTTSTPDGDLGLERASSDINFRWRPRSTLSSGTYYRLQRASYGDQRSSEMAVGTGWTYQPLAGLTATGHGSVQDVRVVESETEQEPSRFMGEQGDVGLVYYAGGRQGSVEVGTQGGLAAVQEYQGDSGVQVGTGGMTRVTRAVAMNFVRVGAGASARRQWDSSPRDLDYLGYGWETFMETRQVAGANLHLRLSEAVVEQRSADEGNSDLFEAAARANWNVSERARLGYTLSIYRDVLDDSYLNGLAHAARVDVGLTETLSMNSLYYYRTYDEVDDDAMWSHRLDSSLHWDLRIFDVSARHTFGWYGGRVPETRSQYLWVELSRSFEWRL